MDTYLNHYDDRLSLWCSEIVVEEIMYIVEVSVIYMCIDLCSGDRTMSQESLYWADIGSLFE